ncbi:glycosyltransferase family 4 protein [Chamaesiphon minutus]|uniref:Glycosyltransferase n=1 Tax=Chamaesiphon minutus (strain ATCC 27169 / PCC 6605) TaxID=1173020 RepID=K9UPS2_CHAP6|nr:glycosyltransferase family 4 protein [Chamaesiphon minutus]AFY96790.1 glycosyltransferase [Chamaesiphon minutus PCC 6605]
MHDIRIAWLLPVAWFYWQPAIAELTKFFPNTTVFTGLFPGFAKGLEGGLKVEVVGEFKVIEIAKDENSYGDNFTYLSPKIIGHLLKLRPQVIFSSSFGIWTMIALLLKPLFWWRVIIAYEGCSPGVDYRNSAARLFVRRLMIWMADAYITNSNAGSEYLIEILKAKKELVFVQPYEIPDEHTLPAIAEGEQLEQLNLPPHQPVFLFVGQIIPRKGLPLLLQACSLLQARGYQQFTLLVVGNGPQQQELETFCQEHHLSDRVRWAGRVNFDKIGTYFHNADVFVLPTLEDTWGVVTLEAMLLGKPILCSSGAGTSELVVSGENGYVFTPEDPDKLADLMQLFLDDPTLILAMGARSQQIMAQYTPLAAAQCMAEVAELVMANRADLPASI